MGGAITFWFLVQSETQSGLGSPVAPFGDADRLDDEDHHLAEEYHEEEEEAEGAVGSENNKQEVSMEIITITLNKVTKAIAS